MKKWLGYALLLIGLQSLALALLLPLVVFFVHPDWMNDTDGFWHIFTSSLTFIPIGFAGIHGGSSLTN